MLFKLLLTFVLLGTAVASAQTPVNYATTYACPEVNPAQPNCRVP